MTITHRRPERGAGAVRHSGMRRIGLAGGLILVLAGFVTAGCGPLRAHTAAVARPHPAVARPHPAAARWRVVSYHGVHVAVPSRWPVVDGMHVGPCFPFPAAPEVFVGPNYNGAYSCPPYIGRRPGHDGVWLASGPRPAGARRVRSSRDVTVLESGPGWNRSVLELWYRHVAIEIGIGPDPRIARRILGSIGYSRGQPDTRDTGDCARVARVPGMPTPARLAHRLVIDYGDITLNPPLPSDQPVMTAAAAWQQAGAMQDALVAPYLRYRVLLVRYSAKYPADNGPVNNDVLAWVVYSLPRTPIAGCGGWALNPFNALTGGGMGSYGWSPGP